MTFAFTHAREYSLGGFTVMGGGNRRRSGPIAAVAVLGIGRLENPGENPLIGGLGVDFDPLAAAGPVGHRVHAEAGEDFGAVHLRLVFVVLAQEGLDGGDREDALAWFPGA